MAKRTLSVTSLLKSKADDLARQRKCVQILRAHSGKLAQALALTDAVQRLADSTWASPSAIEWDENHVDLRVVCRIKVDSLKGEKMAAILEAAEAMPGMNATSTRDWATAGWAERDFEYRGSPYGVDMVLKVEAELPINGEACKRVQTGVKLEEVPQYEIVCE